MPDHRAVGRRVADLTIEPGRVPQVGEDDRQAPDRHVLAGPQRLRGEQVAERLQRGDVSRGRRLVRPGGSFSEVQPLDAGRVRELDGRPGTRPPEP